MIRKRPTSVLEKIGFNAYESALYTALLELGPASISDIVRKTGIHRPTVYRSLPTLIGRGLVGVMPKGKNKIYIAESPEKLQRLLTELQDEFNSEIHSLNEMYESRGKKPLIKFSEGDHSLKDAYSDVVHSLKKNDVYYRYSSALTLARKKFVPDDYMQVRDRKGLERYIITGQPTSRDDTKKLGKSVRRIPPGFDLFGPNITQIIYGNKVTLIDYITKTVINIDNKMIAEFQKRIFKLLYSKL